MSALVCGTKWRLKNLNAFSFTDTDIWASRKVNTSTKIYKCQNTAENPCENTNYFVEQPEGTPFPPRNKIHCHFFWASILQKCKSSWPTLFWYSGCFGGSTCEMQSRQYSCTSQFFCRSYGTHCWIGSSQTYQKAFLKW